MIVVAITDLPDGREPLAAPLAEALGKTLYEVRSRLLSPGPGPFVAGIYQDEAQCSGIVSQLERAGFSVLTIDPAVDWPPGSRLSVKRFEASPEALSIWPAGGEAVSLNPSSVGLILKGVSASVSTDKQTVKERKFDLGRAVMTGGLMLTSSKEKTVMTSSEEREGFFSLLSSGGPVVEFRETSIDYNCLGDLRKPTRRENFAVAEAEIRRHCTNALFDDRLVNRQSVVRLLGPSLDPIVKIDIAVSLLAKALLG